MNFDLNLNNYKLHELEEIFNLPKNYNSSTLDNMDNKLRENILTNNNINQEVKSRTLQFLTEAKKVIINSLMNNSSKLGNVITDFYNASFDLKAVPVIDNGENMVQKRKDKPYLSSYPSEFFTGVINPIKKRTNREILNIDTRFRNNYYGTSASNFHFDLPIKLSNVLTMQLTAFESPLSFYNISSTLGNNYFFITIDYISQKEKIVIPDGIYNYELLVTFLNNALTSLGGEFAKIRFIAEIVPVNNGNGKMIVEVDPSYSTFNFVLNFSDDFFGNEDNNTSLQLKFGWLIGFRCGNYSSGYSYISEGIIDLIGPRYLYLVIDDFNNSVNDNFYSAFTTSILHKNILARISIQGKSFDLLSENNLNIITYPRNYYGPVDIQKMQIQLLDEYGRIVDLNFMDYSFCLTFQTVYDL